MQSVTASHSKTTTSLWRLAVLLCLGLLASSCSSGVYHTVKPGQNLYRISKTYGVDKSYLARINGISDPTKLQAGTKLYIPGANQLKYVAPAKTAVKTTTKKPATPSAPRSAVKKPSPVTKKSKPPVSSSNSNSGSIEKLKWPLRGKIVRTFSSKAKAGGGKGIEIAVRAGSAVKAAEAGRAIYSGDGVKGYGHLIILQHANDLFTVYGFNQENLVQQGDFVSQGEKIAYSGIPPSGGQARLHFEVRKGKQAVNPILYLP